jgi:chorismate mutase-like protein
MGPFSERLATNHSRTGGVILTRSNVAIQTATELFGDHLMQDPYPTYRQFLDAGTIHYVNYRQGAWAIFSYGDCSRVIRDPRLTAKRAGLFLSTLAPEQRAEFAELARLFSLWMLFIDAPEHTRLRKLMNHGFSPAVMESLRPKVEAIVDGMLEPLPSDEKMITPRKHVALCFFIVMGGTSTALAQIPTDNFDGLVETSAHRLEIAKQVALAKWDSGSEVEDRTREDHVVASAVNAGNARGLDRALVTSFFEAQIEASELAQYTLLAN